MAMIVRARGTIRFERRWQDYCHVVEEGTSPLVGRSKPTPPDVREAVRALLLGPTAERVEAANSLLDEAWASDAINWPKRLRKPFLNGLSSRADNAFANLVKAGCQPDMLALQFHKATQVKDSEKHLDRIRAELEMLGNLSTRAVAAVRALASRRQQFDEYLASREFGVPEGDAGDAELQILKVDLEDLAEQHRAADLHLMQQIDGRRKPLIGHAEVRLSRQVHEATGHYHDRDVEDVLGELRERLGLPDRAHGSLKRRRARWMRELAGKQAFQNEGRKEGR